MNVGKAPLLLGAIIAALFLLWEFVLVPVLGVAQRPPSEMSHQGTSKR